MNLLRIGQELSSRGHKFIWLISDSHQASHKLVNQSGFEGLEVLAYRAVGENITVEALSRDPAEVETFWWFRPNVRLRSRQRVRSLSNMVFRESKS
ncbi:hypothetical protein WJX84_001161 [Apatococcus fuscideae]|uniref:Uncharacterized protein n=1 Tax=Apatococcus fuscideae TaxID=2026836 RepID=A0AAW1RMP7_9CHLO